MLRCHRLLAKIELTDHNRTLQLCAIPALQVELYRIASMMTRREDVRPEQVHKILKEIRDIVTLAETHQMLIGNTNEIEDLLNQAEVRELAWSVVRHLVTNAIDALDLYADQLDADVDVELLSIGMMALAPSVHA
ncbi:MAG: hypothetical protein Q8P90_05715 [bacterium]|nr:hypothetical protein [bacterium]